MEHPLGNDFIKRYPFPPAVLLPYCLALMAGILIARYTRLPSRVMVSLGSSCLLLSGLLLVFKGRGLDYRLVRTIIIVAMMMVFICLGAIRYISQYIPCENHLIHYCKLDEARLATVRGVILTEPVIQEPQSVFARFDYIHGPHSRFVLACQSVLTYQGWRPVRGMAYATIDEPGLQFKRGQTIELYCRLSVSQPPANPGNRLAEIWYQSGLQTIFCHIKYPESVTLLGEQETLSWWQKTRFWINGKIQSTVLNETSSSDSLVAALLLGQRRSIARNNKRSVYADGNRSLPELVGIACWHPRLAGVDFIETIDSFKIAAGIGGDSIYSFVFKYCATAGSGITGQHYFLSVCVWGTCLDGPVIR